MTYTAAPQMEGIKMFWIHSCCPSPIKGSKSYFVSCSLSLVRDSIGCATANKEGINLPLKTNRANTVKLHKSTNHQTGLLLIVI